MIVWRYWDDCYIHGFRPGEIGMIESEKTYRSRWGEHDVRAGHVVVRIDLADRVRDCQEHGGHDGKGLTLIQIAAQAGIGYQSFTGILSRIEHRDATTVKEETWIKIDLALKTLGF